MHARNQRAQRLRVAHHLARLVAKAAQRQRGGDEARVARDGRQHVAVRREAAEEGEDGFDHVQVLSVQRAAIDCANAAAAAAAAAAATAATFAAAAARALRGRQHGAQLHLLRQPLDLARERRGQPLALLVVLEHAADEDGEHKDGRLREAVDGLCGKPLHAQRVRAEQAQRERGRHLGQRAQQQVPARLEERGKAREG